MAPCIPWLEGAYFTGLPSLFRRMRQAVGAPPGIRVHFPACVVLLYLLLFLLAPRP